MRIYEDHNGLRVNAISSLADGTVVEGHHYDVLLHTGSATLEFQNGPVPANGVNGLTNEALLAVLIHRTEFLNSKFPCVENTIALTAMRNALQAFEARTKARIARGVEGKEVR